MRCLLQFKRMVDRCDSLVQIKTLSYSEICSNTLKESFRIYDAQRASDMK